MNIINLHTICSSTTRYSRVPIIARKSNERNLIPVPVRTGKKIRNNSHYGRGIHASLNAFSCNADVMKAAREHGRKWRYLFACRVCVGKHMQDRPYIKRFIAIAGRIVHVVYAIQAAHLSDSTPSALEEPQR